MQHSRATSTALALAASGLLIIAAACNDQQQATVDSAAASVESTVRTALSIIDIHTGRHVGTNHDIIDDTEVFAPMDTMYAVVHTSGTASNGQVVGRWTSEDGTVLGEQTETVTTDGDGYATFHIAKPDGFAPGKYTLHVIVGGNEVRSKDVTVE